MTQAVKQVCRGISSNTIQPEDVSEELLEQCLYTHLSGLGLKPDLLIRTSGESRLSDFLLWQTSYSVTYFTQVLWPDFSLRNFIYAIFFYQRHAQYRQFILPETHLAAVAADVSSKSDDRVDQFFQSKEKSCWSVLEDCYFLLGMNFYGFVWDVFFTITKKYKLGSLEGFYNFFKLEYLQTIIKLKLL